jgi:prepilin-type N-terminal cleavage/methylation domain-containing protein
VIFNKKTNYQAFTLMELMIVIVIIGILSAVGMVMFGGLTEKAKIAASKANFSTVEKYILNERAKCETGATKAFENSTSCSGSTMRDGRALAMRVVKVLETKIRNPYGGTGITYSGGIDQDWEVGIVRIYGFDSPERLRMRMCFKTPCKDTSNYLKMDVNLE